MRRSWATPTCSTSRPEEARTRIMPPRKRAAPGPTPVEATRHADKRVNLPTADAHDFVGPEVSEVKRLRWERDPSLDPQLVWRGKDDVADELAADAAPIYI